MLDSVGVIQDYRVSTGLSYGELTIDPVPQSDPSPATTPRLGMLWVTDPSPDSLLLSWTVPEGHFDSFMVQYRDRDGRPQVVPVEGPERSLIVSPLDPDHKYRFTLFGIANKKRHGPLMADGTTAPKKKEEPHHPESPEQPLLGELTVTDVTPDSLHLSWTVAQGNFDSFMVQYKDAQGQPQAVPVSGDKNEVTVRSLESDRKYKMNLYGLHGRQRVGPVSVVATTAPQEAVEETTSPTEPSTEAPEPPKEAILGELTVTGSSSDSLSLSWTVPQGHFDSFTIQYKDRDGRPQVVRVGGEESEVTVQGLEPGRKYKMHLYGLHEGQRVGPMSTVGVTEEILAATEHPLKPRLGDMTVTDVTPNSVGLTWTVPEGQFDSFVVQYKDKDGQLQVVPVAADQREATIPGLEPAHKYKMNLYGLHGGQRVGPFSVIAMTAPLLPAPVTESPEKPHLGELTVTDVTPDSVSLSWTVPEGEFDSFIIKYKDRDGQPQVVSVAADQLEVTVPGLEPNRKYKFMLFGIQDGRRHGPVSVEAKTAIDEETPFPTEVEETPSPKEPSTEAPESPEEPLLGDLTVTGSSPDSLSLSWTIPQGHFDSFTIQYKDRDGRPQVVRVEGEESEVTVRGLEPGRKYKMHLYGLHGGQRVGPVSTMGLTVPEEEAPASPSLKPHLGEVNVMDATPDSLHLSWTVPEGQFDHFLVQYKNGDGQPKVVRVPGHENEVTISGLEPDHKYKMNLYGFHDGQRQGSFWKINTKTFSLCQLFKGHFDSFVVQFKDRDGPRMVPVEGHERSVTITPLDPARKYRFLLYGFLGKRRHGPLTADGTTETQSAVGNTGMKRPPKPRLGEELQVTSVTPDSVGLSWTVPEGQFDSFVVQYKDRNGQPQVVPVEGSFKEVSISGLDPARRYKLLLYGLHEGKRVGPVSTIAVTAPREEIEAETMAPNPPESKPHLGELMVDGVTPYTLHLSWTVTEGEFDSFEIQYTDQDGQLQVVSIGGDQNDITLSGLESDHRYRVNLYGFHGWERMGPTQVEAMTAPKEEEDKPSEAPTTTPELPIKPRLGELSVTDTTPDSLHLSWTVPEGQFEHFLVQYKNGDGQPKVVRVPGHEDGVTISGLEPDHKYKMNLYGFHDGQRQGPVSAIGVTVTDAPPDSLRLSWTVSEGQFDHFLVQYKNGDGQPKVVRVPGHEDGVTISGLEPDHKYKMNLYGFHDGQRQGRPVSIGVTAIDEETPFPTEVEETPSPKEPSTEAPESPEEPLLGDLTVTGSSPDSLSLSWTIPQGHFDSFTIQYKDRDGRPQVTSVTPDSVGLSWTVPEGQFDSFVVQYKDRNGQPQVVPVEGSFKEVSISGLDPARRYKLLLYGLHEGKRVGPVSTIAVTAPREEIEAETMAPNPPESKPHLGELMVDGVTPYTLHLSWTVTEGEFDSFEIQYTDQDGQLQVVSIGGDQNDITLSGLESDHRYRVNLYGFHGWERMGPTQVEAMTAPKEEEDKPSEAPTTTPELPIKPRLGQLSVTDTTPDSLHLSWTVPEGQFEHFLVQYKNGDGQPKVVRVPGHEDGVTISGLEPDHKYKMNLYGFHDGQRQGPVSAIGVTAIDEETPFPTEVEETPSPKEPSTEAPESPEEPLLGDLTVTGSSPDSLSLSWTIPQGHFDSFTIQYKDRDGRPQVVRAGGEESEVTVRGLEPGHKYKMHLYGLHGGRRVGPVSTVGVTVPQEVVEETLSPKEPSTEAPEPPKEPLLGDLTVTGSSPDSLSLSWTVPQGHFDSFTIQYKDREGRPQVVRVGGEESEVAVQGLEPGRKYKMHLYGLHGGRRVGPVSTVGVTGK
ncbi:Tenascin-X [Pteropus alecto]|uniref:Tenascin-X n=1 Tax=Pteropus alecto TaxID=9402 RepID=L5L6M6_PTEAL|nr:Tenascin-X [Pteropus alecto]